MITNFTPQSRGTGGAPQAVVTIADDLIGDEWVLVHDLPFCVGAADGVWVGLKTRRAA